MPEYENINEEIKKFIINHRYKKKYSNDLSYKEIFKTILSEYYESREENKISVSSKKIGI